MADTRSEESFGTLAARNFERLSDAESAKKTVASLPVVSLKWVKLVDFSRAGIRLYRNSIGKLQYHGRVRMQQLGSTNMYRFVYCGTLSKKSNDWGEEPDATKGFNQWETTEGILHLPVNGTWEMENIQHDAANEINLKIKGDPCDGDGSPVKVSLLVPYNYQDSTELISILNALVKYHNKTKALTTDIFDFIGKNVINPGNLIFWKGLLPLVDTDLYDRFIDVSDIPGVDILPFADCVHPNTICFASRGGLKLFTVQEVPAMQGTRADEGENVWNLWIEDVLNHNATPVLVQCVKNQKYYSMYMIPKHDSGFTDLFNNIKPGEGHNQKGFSPLANAVAYHCNASLCKGRCDFPCVGSRMFELIFISRGLLKKYMRDYHKWPEDKESDDGDDDTEDEGLVRVDTIEMRGFPGMPDTNEVIVRK